MKISPTPSFPGRTCLCSPDPTSRSKLSASIPLQLGHLIPIPENKSIDEINQVQGQVLLIQSAKKYILIPSLFALILYIEVALSNILCSIYIVIDIRKLFILVNFQPCM